MPIRIRKDKPQKSRSRGTTRGSRQPGNSGGSGGGGFGNIIGSLLPVLLNLFKKNPKIGVVVLIVGIIAFFLIGKMGGGAVYQSEEIQNNQNLEYGVGMEIDEDVYDRAEVFEPLASNSKNVLPSKISLKEYCPKRMNQGRQGSCVGWASAYAARTIQYAQQTGKNPNAVKFSPSYLYNQIALPNCQGSYLQNAMEQMKNGGVAPFSKFAYNENSCSKKQDASSRSLAVQFRTKGYQRLSKGSSDYNTDIQAMKQYLSQGAPVVIGMMVGGTFMTKMNGKKMWLPTKKDYAAINSFGGHAMCVIGYDDSYEGGAFQIMNSWGESWGEKGMFWIKYDDFLAFNREAMALYPMGSSKKYDPSKLEAQVGLVYNEGVKNIGLMYSGGITFKTLSKVKKDKDFKIEVTNSTECYTYVLGEENDGSSYVLFPYDQKHSAYCGITGTRVFPRGYSMYADEEGDLDRMVVLISKKPLDYQNIRSRINNSSAYSFENKVKEAIGEHLVNDIEYEGGSTFNFDAKVDENSVVATIIEIRK